MTGPSVLASPFEYTALKNITVLLVPAIANIATPTLTEVNAGHDVTRHIPKAGVTGFTKTANTVQADNLKTGGAVSLDDGYTLDASSIQFYMDKTAGPTTDVRSILAEGDSPFVLFKYADGTCDIWPTLCQTISKSKQAGQAMMLTASFQTNEPAEDITYPTS